MASPNRLVPGQASNDDLAGGSAGGPRPPIDLDLFKELADTVNNVFWLVQLAPERVLYVSPGFERVWQRTAEAIYENPRLWADSIHIDDRARVRDLYERFLANPDRVAFDIEYRIVRDDGGLRWIHDRARVVRNAAGAVDRVAGMAEDVTSRREAEDALRDSEHRFRQLVQSLPMPIWSCAPDGKCTFLNDTWLAFTGVPLELQLGDGWIAQLHPDDRDRVFTVWRASVESGAPYLTEYRIRRHDGQYCWFEARGTPIRDGHGHIVKWFGANTDINDSRQLRESLRQQQERFTRIAETVPGVIHSFRLRPDGTASFPYASPSIERVYGLRPEDVVDDATAIMRLAHRDDSKHVRDQVQRSAQQMTPFHVEFRSAHPRGGPEMWIEIRSQPVREADGSIIWHGYLADVTDRKRAEDEIRTLNAELEQRVHERTAELEAANRELEAFSYSVSHDLRAPLRAIDGYSGALAEDFGASLPPEAARFLTEVRDGAQRMGALIDNLLDFSRLGRQRLTRRRVDTAKLVHETLAELTAQDAGRPLELRVGELAPCHGDPMLLKQVWVNLLANALKYSRDRNPAIVEVGSERRDGQHEYFVRDNGAGFDMRYASKLFRVFQRLHRTDEFEGTGVGLAIVKRIVERHGGQVSVDAAIGAGATFRFTLGGAINGPASSRGSAS